MDKFSTSLNAPSSGRWTWKEDICGLEFVSYSPNADKGKRGKKLDARRGLEGPGSSRGPLGRGQGHYRMATGTKSKKDQAEHTSVLLDDIKAVAVDMMFDARSMPESFDSLLWTEQFDYFLLHLLSYFNCFFEKIHQDSKKNALYIEPSLSEKKALENAIERLQVAQKLLGRSYCSLLMGLGLEKQHHMECGRSRVSATYKDRSMYETFYTFCAFVVWITFRRRDFEVIKKEVGRMLRSDTFNPALRPKFSVEESAENIIRNLKRGGKQDLKPFKESTLAEYRQLYPKRPPIKSLIEQRSPAVVAILPSPKEEAEWLFDKARVPRLSSRARGSLEDEGEEDIEDRFSDLMIDTKQFKVGIIGEPFSLFNPRTLTAVGLENEYEEGEKVAVDEEETDKSQVDSDHRLSRQPTSFSHATTDICTDDEN